MERKISVCRLIPRHGLGAPDCLTACLLALLQSPDGLPQTGKFVSSWVVRCMDAWEQEEGAYVIFSFSSLSHKPSSSTHFSIATLVGTGALGMLAPCVLHGSTSERLNPSPTQFRESCSAYLALLCVGNLLTHFNVFAPCYSAGSRSAIRRKYHLKVRRLYIKDGLVLVCNVLSSCRRGSG